MSERTEFPSPDRTDDTVVTSAQSPASSRRDVLPWLCGLGFLVLAGGIYVAWQYPRNAGSTAIQGIEQRLADLGTRISRLEQRPVPASQDEFGKLSARLDVLEGRTSDQTQLGSRVDAVSGRIESLSSRIQTGLDTIKQQVQTGFDSIKQQEDRLAGRIAALEKDAGSLDSVSDHLNRLARIQEANLALAAGRPVGDIPGAPPALARFAQKAPPTETQLRLLFSQSEHAAIAAKQPNDTTSPFIDRVWERAQNLVTVQRGDDVVVGNPASVTLGQARAALDAGDLKGAINAVELLKGQPRQAMANWLAEAKSLVEARAALTDMAGQS
jgi:hypothetical protein